MSGSFVTCNVRTFLEQVYLVRGMLGACRRQVHLVRGMLGACIVQDYLRQQRGNCIDMN